MNYRITYSVGTTRHDERRYVVTAPEALLARRISQLQAGGKRIHSVEIAH